MSKVLACMTCRCDVEVHKNVSKVRCGACRQTANRSYAAVRNKTENGRAARYRYRSRDDFYSRIKVAQQKYSKTDKCKTTRAAYRNSPKNRFYESERRKSKQTLDWQSNFRASTEGRLYAACYRADHQHKEEKRASERKRRSARNLVEAMQLMKGLHNEQRPDESPHGKTDRDDGSA